MTAAVLWLLAQVPSAAATTKWEPLTLIEPCWSVDASVGASRLKVTLDSGWDVTCIAPGRLAGVGRQGRLASYPEANAVEIPIMSIGWCGFPGAIVCADARHPVNAMLRSEGLDGILGYDFLRNCAIAVDFDRGRFLLTIDPTPKEALGLLFESNSWPRLAYIPISERAGGARPLVDVLFGSAKRSMILDIGSPITLTGTPIEGSADWPVVREQDFQYSGGEGRSSVRWAPSLRVGPYEVLGAVVATSKQHLGFDVLSWTTFAPAGKVLFDFKNHEVVLENKATSGIECFLAEMGLKLLDSRVLVRPATYAAAVGLRPEDRILAVGGRAVADGTLAAVCHGAPGRQQEFLTLASASMSVVASRDGKIRTAFVGRFGGERIVTWEPGAATRLPRTLRFGAEKARAKAESALYLVPTAGIAVVPDGMDVRLSVNGYTFVESTGSGVLKPGAVRLDHSTGETRVVEPGESVRFSVDRPGQWGVFVPKGTAVPRLEPDGNGGGGFVLQVGQAVKR